MTDDELNAIASRVTAAADARNWGDAYELGALLCGVLEDDAPALLAEVRRLREALGFYADEANYETHSIEWVGNGDMMSTSTVQIDEGETARVVLAPPVVHAAPP